MLQARNVSFDWSSLPLHYVDDNALATHLINVMHLLLPEGEEWFVRTFKEALPLIHDEQLRDDVIGFIGQEAMHATAPHPGARVSDCARHGRAALRRADAVPVRSCSGQPPRAHAEQPRRTCRVIAASNI